jgi:translation initiation factor IF-2
LAPARRRQRKRRAQASASGAIIIAFGVRPSASCRLAQQEGVDIRVHNIIYEVSDEIKKAMEGLLEPSSGKHLGRAEVRNTFRVKGAGTIAGCYVVDGISSATRKFAFFAKVRSSTLQAQLAQALQGRRQ